MKKLFRFISSPVRFCFQPEYRKKQQLKKGRKLWLLINKDLPQATGDAFDDEPRLEKFKLRISFIPSIDQKALRKWLEYRFKKLQRESAEDVSYQVKKEKEKIKKIYQEHLNLIPK